MRRATNADTVLYGGSAERAARSRSSATCGWTGTLLRRCQHLLQALDEERRAFHDARLLALHERADLLQVLLPVRVGGHRGTALLALVKALVGPHVHDHVERADFG